MHANRRSRCVTFHLCKPVPYRVRPSTVSNQRPPSPLVRYMVRLGPLGLQPGALGIGHVAPDRLPWHHGVNSTTALATPYRNTPPRPQYACSQASRPHPSPLLMPTPASPAPPAADALPPTQHPPQVRDCSPANRSPHGIYQYACKEHASWPLSRLTRIHAA